MISLKGEITMRMLSFRLKNKDRAVHIKDNDIKVYVQKENIGLRCISWKMSENTEVKTLEK